jgi:hypothetical protein
MSPVAQRVVKAVYHNGRGALCFTCLAAQQGLREHDVRGVALVLTVRAGLRVVRRSCSVCRRVADGLVRDKVA